MPSLILLTLLVLAKPHTVLTPGVVRPLTVQQICATKWRLDHRHVTTAMRKAVFHRYGIPWSDRRFYEVDHLIPRELAGQDAILNLWPQVLPAARVKDRRENALHRAVCRGEMSLGDAQAEMRAWGR